MTATLSKLPLAALTRSLAQHPLYQAIQTPEELRVFCERHVFAVWDFMALLKSLQRELTGLDSPWVPTEDGEAARFLNEIVLGEESDEIEPGRYGSHFVWYLEAMEEIGADTGPIRTLVDGVRRGQSVHALLDAPEIPGEAAQFTRTTLGFLDRPLHERAAVFFHGREDLIPQMFVPLVERFVAAGHRCERLLAYLRRHIEVDGDSHGPLAQRLLERLYAGQTSKRLEAEQAAHQALVARHRLWDTTVAALAAPSS